MAAAPAPERTDLDLVNFLVNDFQAIEHGGSRNDGGAVLVVVENQNRHPLFQFSARYRNILGP